MANAELLTFMSAIPALGQRCFRLFGVVVSLGIFLSTLVTNADLVPEPGPGSIFLPGSAAGGPFKEVVLFGFDNRAFPFQNLVQTRLFTGKTRGVVLPPGSPGSPDEVIQY